MIDLENLHPRYRELLLDDVVPFWFRHGIDRTNGGVLTCMSDDGTLVSAEWRQRLTREGKPTTEIVALPVKDPFHLPRGIILILQLLERMQADQAGILSMGSAHGTGRQQ